MILLIFFGIVVWIVLKEIENMAKAYNEMNEEKQEQSRGKVSIELILNKKD